MILSGSKYKPGCTDFYEWLSGMEFHLNYDRYGQSGCHGHVVVAEYSGPEKTGDLVSELDAGDSDAINAWQELKEIETAQECWISSDVNPAIAMTELISKISDYYFLELNIERII